ncbi:MAG: transglycosylase domain-containing protein [bacterium]
MPEASKSFTAQRRYSGFLLLILLGTPVLLLLAGSIFFYSHRDALLDFENKIGSISNNSLLYDYRGRPFRSLKGLESREILSLSDFSRELQLSVLAAEDSRFFQHRGVDLLRIFGAIWANLQSRSVRQGASTITQQLVKVTLLEPEQTLRRKVKEMAISIWLELYLGKEKILEHYLNSIYLGHGHYGMERASQAYFQKNVNDLTLAQAAFLAALIKKPEHYLRISELKTGRKYFSLEELKDVNQRQQSILRRMLELEWIDDQTFQRASDEKLNVLVPNPETGSGNYFVQHVINLLRTEHGLGQVYGGGWRIWTTFHPELQQLLEEVIQQNFAEDAPPGRQVAAVAMDPNSGEVLALSGGRNFKTSSFNRATQARRQPGSALKPLLYATALEQSFRPNSSFEDSVLIYDWEDEGVEQIYAPKNYDGLYGEERILRNHLGGTYRSDQMTLGKALELSINTIAVQLLDSIGIGSFVEKSRALDLEMKEESGLCLALGCSESSLLKLTSAYTVFLNQGRYLSPVFIKRIEDSSGRLIYRFPENEPKEIFSQQTMLQMQDLLKSVIQNGTGRNANWPTDNQSLLGKTGTSSSSRDAWFVGAYPALLSGFWIGHDENLPMPDEQGGGTPARLWSRFSEKASSLLPYREMLSLPEPIRVPTCRVTGLLATENCPDVSDYPYFDDQVPIHLCDQHPGEILSRESREVQTTDQKLLESEP